MGKRAEKRWTAGEQALERTRLQLAQFGLEDSIESRDVLRRIMRSDNEKEARLAAERVRDELGMTRVVKPTEQARIIVTVDPRYEAMLEQHRASPKRIQQHPADSAGWREPRRLDHGSQRNVKESSD